MTMHVEDQRGLVGRFRALQAAKSTDLADEPRPYPASEYTSAERLAAERERLFRGGPVVAALSADVRGPGAFCATEVDGMPLVAIRGRDERVRVFLNACRHRGSPVASGRGCTESVLTCPYHAWAYNLDGSLRNKPLADDWFVVDGEGFGLIEVPSGEAGGLVFARLDGGPMGAVAFLGPLAGELDAYGLSGYHHVETRTARRDINWKMVIDTFLEAYHIFSLHKDSIAKLYHPHPMLFDAWGPHSRLIGVRRSIDELGDDPATWSILPHATIQHLVFPNTLVVHQLDHFEVWRVFPDGDDPGRSVIETSLYAPEPPRDERALAHWTRNLDLLLQVTYTEDFTQCERIQRTMAAGATETIWFGRNEPALIHFHDGIADAVGLPRGAEPVR